MGMGDSIQKLRAYGLRYALQYKAWRPLRARVRAVALASEVSSVGPGLEVHGPVTVQRDKASVIALGAGCTIDRDATLRSTRASAVRPPAEIRVGDGTMIKQGAMVLARSGRIVIGARSAVGRYSEIGCEDVEVRIGDCVRIAPQVWIGTGNHLHDDLDRPIMDQGVQHLHVTIEDDVWLGTRVVVLPGVTIGEGSVVAAGAVVAKDVPPYVVVGGVPARVLKDRRARF